MIREDYAGTQGVKSYELKIKETMLNRFKRSNNSSFITDVRSVSLISGQMNTFQSNDLMWNYDLSNDGARIATRALYNEATIGISSRVNGATGYLWKGNITRWESAPHYNTNGASEANHTVWLFIR